MSKDVPTLKGAQDDVRSAFFAHESGLFVLDCVPGFGKSLTVERIAAELLVRLHEDNVRCPERHLCIASFSRNDAASLEPGIRDALDGFAADDVDSAVTIDDATADHLKERLRYAEHLGTIDSVLRSVFSDIATELGFDGMPSVGNDALQSTLKEDCLDALRSDSTHARAFATLDKAYPGDDGDCVGEMLEEMRNERRSRRLSHDEFRTRLHETVAEVYPSGRPESLTDICADIVAFYDADTAAEFISTHTSEAAPGDGGEYNDDTADAQDIVESDQECYDEWQRCIDLLCDLLEAYEAMYDQECRERGVLAYTDVAYWVAEFFERPPEQIASGDAAATRDYRDRLIARYARQFQAVFLDEAQDVSIVQHDALAHVVPADARVLLAADMDQCIYEWRQAKPSLFSQALNDGTYFGTDWSNHKTKTGDKSYRLRPDIAHSVNHVFSTVFVSADYGHDAGTHTIIDPNRSATDAANVHVAKYAPSGTPNSGPWTRAEATSLANLVRGCIENGTLDLRGHDTEPLTVLFRTRTNMDAFADAFQANGLHVANGSRRVFTDPLVEVICAVASWLVNPHDPDRITALLDDDSIPLRETLDDSISLSDLLANADDPVDAIAALEAELEADTHKQFVRGLTTLAARQPRLNADPGIHLVEAIIETLGLQTDPFDQADDDDRQRLAVLDTLIDAVNDWEGDDRYSISDLARVLTRYRNNPKNGPQPPLTDPDAYDIVFRTCYDIKGDENDAVCIADAAGAIDTMSSVGNTFSARGSTLALAPPSTAPTPPVRTKEQSAGNTDRPGFRWSSDHQATGHATGPPPLTRMQTRHRAEQWRLLYVAMTRARNNLVLSLPDTPARNHRDHWTATIRKVFDFSEMGNAGTHTVNPNNPSIRAFSVAVNNVPFDLNPLAPQHSIHRAGQAAAPTKTGWTPRYVNASQLHPLLANPDQHRLDYLRNRSLHTETANPDQESELNLNAIDPDAVGHIAHDVLTAAVADDDITTNNLRSCCSSLKNQLDRSLTEYAPAAPRDERETVRAFIENKICPRFADTAAWNRLQDADRCYVEEKLSSILDYGLETETHNRADVVSVDADGNWHIDDLKILLTSPEDQQLKRYNVQARFYAFLLERQLSSEGDVTPWVTKIGADAGTNKAEQSIMDIEAWIEQSLERLSGNSLGTRGQPPTAKWHTS